jgi:hypothetical protein
MVVAVYKNGSVINLILNSDNYRKILCNQSVIQEQFMARVLVHLKTMT